MPTPAQAIGTYIQAKDGNRPCLMRRAFVDDAVLEMVVKTDVIAFPASARGLDAITDVLIRRFVEDYENVYTFCLAPPPHGRTDRFSCRWLVGMSSRSSGAPRVGCGRYDWQFRAAADGMVEQLKITIERMHILPPDRLGAIMGWFDELPYPWCSAAEATKNMPALRELAHIAAAIEPTKTPAGVVAGL
jgi:hypothetical protein